MYAQSEDGAYFLYNMECTEDDAARLVPGTRIRVNGYKAEWSGEVEIVDATFEILDGSYIAEAKDVTALLGTDELAAHQNEKVSFKGLTVEAANDAGDAFLYNWTAPVRPATTMTCTSTYPTVPTPIPSL